MKKNSWMVLIALAIIGIACKDVKEKERLTEVVVAVEVETGQQAEVVLLSPIDFQEILNNNTAVQLIDVRTPAEFDEGHLVTAKNINISSYDFASQVITLDKEKAVYVYCRSGGRSARAASQLQQMGFSKIYDLDGGIISWLENALPIED